MATKEQIAANRRNAKRSTGPTSPAGKAASSMNNLRHGLRARTVILPGERQEEFDEILAGLQQESSELYLVKEAAVAQLEAGARGSVRPVAAKRTRPVAAKRIPISQPVAPSSAT